MNTTFEDINLFNATVLQCAPSPLPLSRQRARGAKPLSRLGREVEKGPAADLIIKEAS